SFSLWSDANPVYPAVVTERRHPYLFFGLAAVSLLMFSIDGTVVSVALPNMMLDLQTSLVWLGWTLTAYMLTMTAVMPLAGKLSESFGRMRVDRKRGVEGKSGALGGRRML